MNSKNVLFLLIASVLLLYQVVWPHIKVSAAGLIPPPPDFYACHATGNGTVCQGKVTSEYIGGMDGLCPQGFDLFENGYFEETAIRYYDQDGYLVERVLHVMHPAGNLRNVFYNSRTGTSVAYTSDVTETDSFTVSGDFRSISARFTGNLYMVNLAGTGMLVEDAGMLSFAPTSDLLVLHGSQLIVSSEMEKLCEALK